MGSQGEDGRLPSAESAVLREPQFTEDPSKFVQLTPTITARSERVPLIQAGRYGALWIRLPTPPAACADVTAVDLTRWILECEGYKQGAVYVALPQQTLSQPDSHQFMSVLQSRNYKFYNYHPESDQLIWYKWCNEAMLDLVPPYATSIEGGGVLVLSPDQSQFLLVWERGRWGCPGGAVDRGESCLEAAIRECREEVGLEVDTAFVPLLGAVYNQPSARDGTVNDHYKMFVVRAVSTDLILDQVEVTRAEWFEVDSTYRDWASQRQALGETWPSTGCIAGQPTDVLALEALGNFLQAKCLRMQPVKSNRSQPRDMFS